MSQVGTLSSTMRLTHDEESKEGILSMALNAYFTPSTSKYSHSGLMGTRKNKFYAGNRGKNKFFAMSESSRKAAVNNSIKIVHVVPLMAVSQDYLNARSHDRWVYEIFGEVPFFGLSSLSHRQTDVCSHAGFQSF
uniref:Uncharacterized protein n=1 Tax=Solanum lycopersicum TaxID=4081 RepID=A0A3Q7F824_SOLLC